MNEPKIKNCKWHGSNPGEDKCWNCGRPQSEHERVNTKTILSEVERLHATAKQFDTIKINGVKYTLEFNGRNYVTRNPDGTEVAEFNTRSIKQAKQWLRDYLAN